MGTEILFYEKQRFHPLLVGVILLISLLPVLILVVSRMYKEAGTKPPMSNLGYVITFSVIAGAMILLIISSLETKINSQGITVRFFPFHLKEKHYSWSEISSAQVRQYSPLGEYGGWGLRGMGDDRAFNVQGDMGLQLIFKDGKKLLIGTCEPKELERILTEIRIKNLK